MKNYIRNMIVIALAMYVTSDVAFADVPVVGDVEYVAQNVKDTRLQKWPRATWAESSQCWLVVWREGVIGEDETDIWCARVGADGKTMDPSGIRVATATGIQDHPVVASDGKDFFIAWSDFRNGKEWGVYGARISGGGKVLDGNSIPLAVGAFSQCQPTVIFADGNYLVAWQSFVENVIQYKSKKLKMDFGSYQVQGTRVTSQGKVLDVAGNILASTTALQPALAVAGDGKVWLAFVGHLGTRVKGGRMKFLPAIVRIDAVKCAPIGESHVLGESISSKYRVRDFGGGGIPLSIACVKGGGIVSGRGYLGGVSLFRFDQDGNIAGKTVKMQYGEYRHVAPVATLAVDGDRVILIRDWPHGEVVRKKPNMGVWGGILSPEGEIKEGGPIGFPVAVKKGKDFVQSFVCPGPPGSFLVVYAEPRAVEDTKVVARILR